MTLEVTEEAPALHRRQGYDPVYGARPLRRFIAHEVETRIGRALLRRRHPGRRDRPRRRSAPGSSRSTTGTRARTSRRGKARAGTGSWADPGPGVAHRHPYRLPAVAAVTRRRPRRRWLPGANPRPARSAAVPGAGALTSKSPAYVTGPDQCVSAVPGTRTRCVQETALAGPGRCRRLRGSTGAAGTGASRGRSRRSVPRAAATGYAAAPGLSVAEIGRRRRAVGRRRRRRARDRPIPSHTASHRIAWHRRLSQTVVRPSVA